MAASCSPFTGEAETGVLRSSHLARLSGVGKLCVQGEILTLVNKMENSGERHQFIDFRSKHTHKCINTSVNMHTHRCIHDIGYGLKEPA